MSKVNKILKNKLGIDRQARPTRQDQKLREQLAIEEALLLEQQLVEELNEIKERAAEEEKLRDIEEREKAEQEALRLEEENKIKKLQESLLTPFTKNKKVDMQSTLSDTVNKILPKSKITEVIEIPEPFSEEPALNKELSDFKAKINQHLSKMGFANSSGGGEVRLEFLDDVDRSTATVNGKFLKYDSSSGKFVGADASGGGGATSIADIDIDGGTDIGAALADADLFIVDDGAGGTNRKLEASRIKTYVADVTLTTAAQTNITTVGTLTTLTVDNIIINGTNIGHTSDTDAIAIASNGKTTFTVLPDLHGDDIVLDGTDGSSTDAGDNIVQEAGSDENDKLLFEFFTGPLTNTLAIKNSFGDTIKEISGA